MPQGCIRLAFSPTVEDGASGMANIAMTFADFGVENRGLLLYLLPVFAGVPIYTNLQEENLDIA